LHTKIPSILKEVFFEIHHLNNEIPIKLQFEHKLLLKLLLTINTSNLNLNSDNLTVIRL